MEEIIRIAAIIVLSYLVGSFPTAVIISKRFFGFDIRKKGSGNMGSTNAFRLFGWKWGIVVQVVDILKGILAVVVVAQILSDNINFNNSYFEDLTILRVIAGLSAVAGHIWSCFVGFRGGKGINTAAGMIFGIAPIDASIAVAIFILAVIFSGYISLGSILASITLPTSMFFRYNIFGVNIPGYHIIIYFVIALTVLLVFAHRKNIIRLIKGTENKFSKLQVIKIKTQDNNLN